MAVAPPRARLQPAARSEVEAIRPRELPMLRQLRTNLLPGSNEFIGNATKPRHRGRYKSGVLQRAFYVEKGGRVAAKLEETCRLLDKRAGKAAACLYKRHWPSWSRKEIREDRYRHMNEATKTKQLWGTFEQTILNGSGIDIGCGPDPVNPNVRRFDVEQGDANEITKYVHEKFDYVFSSHCLEHMFDPRQAVRSWWELVKVGGHLIFIVPDEDLYEQGIFPSRFNPDHKVTFTIAKHRSWSPVSVNVLDLALSLPHGQLVSVVLQDLGYDRRLLKHGGLASSPLATKLLRICLAMRRRTGIRIKSMEAFASRYAVVDQTLGSNVVAQIQCIVRKVA
jgi:SAM-dependent methyltransferase